MRTLRVALGKQSYEICIGRGLLQGLADRLESFPWDRRIALVTHPAIDRLYGERLRSSLQRRGWKPLPILLPAGEQYKNIQTLNRLYDAYIKARLERSSPLVAFGGGVIGDMVGFSAATYLRGVPYIQVPTSLLAQVDSSVGGKTGIDHTLGKNLIGAFYQPRLVWIDVDLLNSLPMRELRAGLAEVVKYGVIWDPRLFSYLQRHAKSLLERDPDVLVHVITRCCRIKAQVVSRDEREVGLRAILNYGHTMGHAIESLTGYKSYRHGEAVAIGMVCAARLSQRMGLCDADAVERLVSLLNAFGLPTQYPALRFPALWEALLQDKKVQGGSLRFVLPRRIGEVSILDLPDKRLLKEVLQLC